MAWRGLPNRITVRLGKPQITERLGWARQGKAGHGMARLSKPHRNVVRKAEGFGLAGSPAWQGTDSRFVF